MLFSPTRLRRVTTAAGDTSLSKIAARTGVAPSTISRLLNGRRPPRIGTLEKIVAAYPAFYEDPDARTAA
ncbi:hypothetical protein GCM10009759_55580 [Kitasatospora saccharophila]|uniref:HTH cro/C1-type domain-containing protein n=1 Tax=Kitasatospora saccharophila TaxID=407973 RepID=A0ABN2XK07_9ACTN